MNVGKLIAQGRQAKEMSQKDLATKICEKPQVAAVFVSYLSLHKHSKITITVSSGHQQTCVTLLY